LKAGLARRWCCLLLVLAGCAQAADRESFDAWMQANDVGELERYLAAAQLGGVVATRQLLRTATDWQRCNGPRFEIPPREHWPQVRSVVSLVAELKRRGILREVEAASGYRNPELNACAGGAPRSSHTRSFALDFSAAPGQVDIDGLCGFWRREGRDWAMGLSRYPSGRIHLDTSGWRTWGADHTHATSFCGGEQR
jgi:hypothetical protein